MRTRVKLAFIENKIARSSSRRKRINGPFKKMSEISTLCNILDSAIIYCPGDAQPWIWPKNPLDVGNIVEKFLRRIGYDKTTWRKTDLQDFLTKFIEKSEKVLAKVKQYLKHITLKEKMYECLAPGSTAVEQLDDDEASDMLLLIEDLVDSMDRRIRSLNQSATDSSNGAATLGDNVAADEDH